MSHSWVHSKARGIAGERLVRAWMDLQGWTVEAIPDTDPRQRLGLDFIVADGDHQWTVEVKSCSRGDVTGNVFIETLSVSGDDKHAEQRGWLHTCQADWLYYLLVYSRQMIVCRMDAVRDMIPTWQTYPIKTVQNAKYHGEGWIVPVDAFTRCAEMVVRL